MKKQKALTISSLCIATICFSGCASYLYNTDNAKDNISNIIESRNNVLSNNNVTNSIENIVQTSKDETLTTHELLPIITGMLSLDDAITIALGYNGELKKTYLKKEEARGRMMQATSAALPQINLNGNVTGYAPSSNGMDNNASSLTLEIRQTLLNSGATSSAIEYAKLYALSTDFEIIKMRQDTVYNVIKCYKQLQLRNRLLKVYEEANDTALRSLTIAKTKNKHGTASKYEVLRAEVEVANTNADLIKSKNALKEAKFEFLKSLNISHNSEIELSDELDLSFENILPEKDNSISLALKNRVELAMSHANILMAEEELNICKAEFGPKVNAFANLSYSDERSSDSWEDEWRFGLSAELNIFDGLQKQGKIVSAKAKHKQAIEDLHMEEQSIITDTIKSIIELDYAFSYFNSQDKNTKTAEEMLRIIMVGFKEGKNTQVEVYDAQSSLTKALGNYYESIYATIIAKLNYEKAIGTDLTNIQL